GASSHIPLRATELDRGQKSSAQARRAVSLGQFTVSALAGNAVLRLLCPANGTTPASRI
ncbi:hypothetical protein PHLGIDRAFT_72204, partial [Phlebiopsis gigantea 11061_1 CR5-6]